VRIEHGHAVTGFNVLRNQIFEQRRFPAAGLSDDVCVLSPISKPKTERLGTAPYIPLADSHEKFLL